MRTCKASARASCQDSAILDAHSRTRMVCCSAGVSPAFFPTPPNAKLPARRRRYEKPTHSSVKLYFVRLISHEKCGLLNRILILWMALMLIIAIFAFDGSAQANMKVRV